MDDKISLAACTGMSALGLVSRAAVSDYVEENENAVSICITSTATDKKGALKLIERFPIVSVNGCSHCCADKILESKGVAVKSTIDVSEHIRDYNAKNISRLGENEPHVEAIIELIEKEIDRINVE